MLNVRFGSIATLPPNCIEALVHGKDLNILLFDENDVKAIIGDTPDDGVKFTTVLTEKLFAAGQTGVEQFSSLLMLIQQMKQRSLERNSFPLMPNAIFPLHGNTILLSLFPI